MCSLQAEAAAQAVTRKSHYRGVRKRSEDRFAAEIRDPSKRRRIWLGTFSSDIEAAHAYDWAARAIKGCKAKTNFPLSAYRNPKPVKRSAAYKNPGPINTNMVAKAAPRPILPKPSMSAMFPPMLRRQLQLAAFKMSNQPGYNGKATAHAIAAIHEGCKESYLNKTFNVGTSSSPSLLQAMFPPELQRQQQLAALKMSNRPRCNDTEGNGGVGEIREGCKEIYSPCNSSDPSSSAVKECRDSPTMGVLDLNLPAPVEEDECDHSPKTLWLFK